MDIRAWRYRVSVCLGIRMLRYWGVSVSRYQGIVHWAVSVFRRKDVEVLGASVFMY